MKSVLVVLLVLASLAVPTRASERPSTETDMPEKLPLQDRLRRATDGLVYQSESDAPVDVFVVPGFGDAKLTPEAILTATKHDASTKVETVDVATFFDPLVELQDWYGDDERRTARQYARLRKLLTGSLADLTVFRLGERTVDIYIVGRTETGDLVGISTHAVET